MTTQMASKPITSDKPTIESKKKELRHRVEAKRKELEARLEELKTDTSAKKDQAIAATKQKLGELEQLVSDGWDQMREGTLDRLNSWLGSCDSCS